ncbi:MAG: hydantoinase B/oxoprolinase family protein [Candidatus Bathyarchaeia archaeon]
MIEQISHIHYFGFGGFHPDYREYYACYDIEGGGWGGRAFADGNDVLCVINGNCRLIPVEVFETRFPWLIHEFKLYENSGGAGKFRGGLGSVKVLEALADEITVSQVTDRHKISPWGLFGGGTGARGQTLVKRKGSGRMAHG